MMFDVNISTNTKFIVRLIDGSRIVNSLLLVVIYRALKIGVVAKIINLIFFKKNSI